jgi:hypothetical protein
MNPTFWSVQYYGQKQLWRMYFKVPEYRILRFIESGVEKKTLISFM